MKTVEQEIREDPMAMYWINEYWEVVVRCGYENSSLIDQYNLVMNYMNF